MIIYLISFLLTMNILSIHGYRLQQFYYWSYKRLIKPKFKVGDLVIINNYIFVIMAVTTSHRPYTYFCLPAYHKHATFTNEHYFHESRIKKLTGILKELE